MKSLLLFFFAVIYVLLPRMSRCQGKLNDTIVKHLNASVSDLKNRYHSPSIVVLVVRNHDVIYSQALGYTDVAARTPASVDAKYPVMSMTKPFTATMLMQLVQRGIVSLSDNVNRYLPEFQQTVAPADKRTLTLLQLATHTSGLPRNSQADIQFTQQIDRWLLAASADTVIEPATTAEFLNSLKYLKCEYPTYQFLPYGDRHYSNLGYCMLGMALERAAGIDYPNYMIKNILQPLRMNNSGFITGGKNKAELAKGYFYDDEHKTLIQTPFFKPNSAIYAGGLYTTASDLAKFLGFQFDRSANSQAVLSADNKAMMIALNISWKASYPFTSHEGSMIGYRSEIVFNPEIKIGWVVLTNGSDINFSSLNDIIARAISPAFEQPVPAGLAQYAGKYTLAGGIASIRLYLQGGALHSTYLKGVIPDVALSPAGTDRFKGAGRGAYTVGYEFVRQPDGGIKALNMGQFMWVKQ